MTWWTDWFVALLIASGVLLIFKGGIALSILLWTCYLGNGAKAVKAHPNKENEEEYSRHLVIGIIVIVVSIIFLLSANS